MERAVGPEAGEGKGGVLVGHEPLSHTDDWRPVTFPANIVT